MAQSRLSWPHGVIAFKIGNLHYEIEAGLKYRIDSEGVFR